MADELNENKAAQKPAQSEPLKDQSTEQGELKGKTNSKKIIIYSAIIAVQLIAAILLVKFLLLPMLTDDKVAASEIPVQEEVKESKELGTIYKLENLTINPKNSFGQRFGVFEIVLETLEPENINKIKKYEPILRDNFIGYYSSKTVEELSLPSIREKSKSDLKDLANQVLGDDVIRGVYYTRYVLQ